MKSCGPLWSVACLALVFSQAARGQPYIESEADRVVQPDPAIRSEKRPSGSPREGWGLEASAVSGTGNFRDIQVPINRDYDMRADGRKIGEENAEHLAFIAGGSLSPVWRGAKWRITPLDMSLLRMTSLSGPLETMSAAYTRFDLRAEASWELSLGKPSLVIDAQAGWRRSEFNNGSDSHFVASIPLGFGVKFAHPLWEFQGYAHYAPQSQFGYSQALLFGGSPLEGSSSTLSDYGCKAHVRISPGAWLVVGAEQESIRVIIRDVKAYEAFGFAVQDPRKARDYVLTTSALTLGVRKVF